jgi:hypothetical protein
MKDSKIQTSSLHEIPSMGEAITLRRAEESRPIVMVIGMHRSGTSLCSHALSALGVDMADQVIGPGSTALSPDNPKGHWERWEIVSLHDRILGLLNRPYHAPTHDLGFPDAWWADPRVAVLRKELASFLKKRMGDSLFGFKDPRTVRLMPVWYQLMNELKLTPKVIFCLRNPAQVARSLYVRDGLEREIGEARWFSYAIDFFRYVAQCEFCTIEYELWFDDISSNLNRLASFLHLDWRRAKFSLDQIGSGIVEAQFRHDDRQQEATQPIVRSLYHLAQRADGEPTAWDQIQSIVAHFIGFQQLQFGIQRSFEQIATAAARLPAMEQEATEQRSALAEREAAVAAAMAELSDAKRQAQEGSIEAQQLHNEIAILCEALADAKRQAQEGNIEAQQLHTEIAILREALADAKRQVQEVVAEAQRLRAETATFREARAEAEQKLQVSGEVEQQLSKELAVLRGGLVHVQAEIASLRQQLTVSSQVGKGLVAALRWDTAPLPDPMKSAS